MRWWLVLPAVAGCASDAPSLLDEPLGTLPPRLSQVGLYADVSRRDAVDARAVAYEPRFPLWSNGADKARWIVAPSPIDLEAGDVPAGTLLFKTFEFPDAEH